MSLACPARPEFFCRKGGKVRQTTTIFKRQWNGRACGGRDEHRSLP